jgi:hypothetical protein
MTTRPYELLARFGRDGKIAGVSIRTITTIDGRDYESDPQPLLGASDPAFVSFAEQFAAATIAENEALKTENAKLTSDLATMTTERDSAITAKTQADASIEELEESITSLEIEKQTLATQLAAATEKVRSYEDAIWDRRKIDPSAWYARLTMENVLAIAKLAADDEIAKSFVVALDESRALRIADPTYLMSLDHPNAVQGTAYLMANGALSQDDVVRLMADSRRDEQ